MKKLFGIIALILVCLLLVALRPAPKSRMNVILIVTDDQWYASTSAMPITQQKLWNRSVVFEKAYTTTPLCCPSRAGILTGQYGHNNNVLRNTPPHGGYPSFEDAESIAVWMDRAGYQTALFGKYLNLYNGEPQPVGWDEWQSFTHPPGYWDYALSENGTIVPHTEYSTDLLFDRGIGFIEANQARPFFLYLAPFAPHAPTEVKPEDAGLFADYAYSDHAPAFNEADIADKPAHIVGRGYQDTNSLDEGTRQRLRLLAPVDRGIGRLMDYLDSSGLAQNTIVIFVSDNGVLRGEHRLDDKSWPYEEAIHIPMSIYVPNIPARSSDALVLNIDIAPTILSLTGTQAPPDWVFDGKDISPIVKGKKPSVRGWFWIEFLTAGAGRSTFWGVHTGKRVYIEHATGEREYYDLLLDPYQLDNRANDPTTSKARARMEDRLDEIRALMQPYLP